MSNDRRRNFRFAVQPELSEARMRVRGEWIDAEIIEQSAGGFRVSVTAAVKLAVNDPADLETWAGNCTALVAYVEDVAGGRRIGLQRTSDVIPHSGGWFSWLWRPRKPAKARPGAWVRRRVLVGGILLAALLGGGWLANYLAAERHLAVAAGARDLNGEPLPGVPAVPQVTADQQPPAVEPSAEPEAVEDPIAVLERLVSLQKKDVAAELELSEYQKLQISRLVADTARSLNRLQSRRAAKTPAERREKIATMLARADRRALEILTPEQRDKWRCETHAAEPTAHGATIAVGPSLE